MLFSFVIIAIMLNMFIAIVMNAYDDYKMEGDDLFGLYDVKLSFIIFVTKTRKYLTVMEQLYTENEEISYSKDDFLGVVRKACDNMSTGGFYIPDVKDVIKYIDIVLRNDKKLKKFENHYFEENSCNIKFQSLMNRRRRNLIPATAANTTTDDNTNNNSSPSASSSSSSDNNNGQVRATHQQVNRALRSDNSGMHSRGLKVHSDNNARENNNNNNP